MHIADWNILQFVEKLMLNTIVAFNTLEVTFEVYKES